MRATRAGAAICIGAVMALVARLRGEAPGEPAPGGWRELSTEELLGTSPVDSGADPLPGTAT